ncbi:LysR family transcriptional regulator [Gemmobacter sp. 24YEA27]|uniref:LysR family transcriptional regulator n=1 Tax=Gemmobacter sp. 24YEA27 TaxID=3040672 RepID=UPI0024B3402B|nr:LysR family transcriptional regulator [Gemmobacter sp. 24YEA27]
MNIDYLKDFLCLSETMNLTVAADLRGTTQSNFSKRLRSLEMWLDHDLIDRTSRPIALTPYGEAFVIKAKSILEDLHDFKSNRTPWDSSSGGVKVATPHAATHYALPNLMHIIRGVLPNIFLLPHLQNQAETAVMLSRTECELAIATKHKGLPLSSELEVFRSVEFDNDRLVMVFNPSSTTVTDQLNLFVPHRNTYLGRIWSENKPTSILNPEIGVGLVAEVRAHCLGGNGIGIIPQSLVEADLELGRLAQIDLPADLTYSYRLFCAPKASPMARQVWDLVKTLQPIIPSAT